MIDYVLNGLLVAIIGLTLLRTLDPARARIRMYLCFIAIVLSALPWHWLGSWLPQPWVSGTDNYSSPASTMEAVIQPVLDASIATSNGLDLAYWLFGVLILVGVLAFARVVSQQYAIIRSWRRNGKQSPTLSTKADDIPVWLVPGESQAVATLFGTREIWIGETLARHPNVEVAIAHELAHHRLEHPTYEWLLTLTRCLFWWNPIVWIFVARARKEIEIECDEYCAREFGSSTYQKCLARLFADVAPVPIGSAFGGRRSFNMERLRRLSNIAVMGWMRRILALLVLSCGVLGFVFVHAEAKSSVEPGHKGWNVRFENVTLRKALEQVAEMSGVDIYVDPRLDDSTFTFEASEIKSWEPLIEGVITEFDDVVWTQRGGVVFVGSRESIKEDSWLSDAIILRGHGAGVFAKQIAKPDEERDALFVDIKFEERFAQEDFNTSQMAILIGLDNPATVRQGDVHITFVASSTSNQLVVGFFKVLPDSKLSEVGRAAMDIEDGATQHFVWPDVGEVDYTLWLTLKKKQQQS